MRITERFEAIKGNAEEKLAGQVSLTENWLVEKGYTSLKRESRGTSNTFYFKEGEPVVFVSYYSKNKESDNIGFTTMDKDFFDAEFRYTDGKVAFASRENGISESAECPVRLITGDSSIQERKDIIADIENMQEVILVATQVIEAGVDIDMDIGYKDISRLDSEEQFIGRINRSCRKDGVVYFFNMDDAKGIYRQDVRVDTDNTLMNEEIREVLNSKDFYDYYEKYVIPVLKNAQGQCNDNNIDEFIRKEVGKLDFNKVADKMKLIDDNRQMYSIYFSRNIIDKNNPENVIEGKKIWKEYKELLQDNHMSYQEKTVKLHNIRSKMNMFMYQFKIELYNENDKPVIEHLEWDEQIGDIFYIENGEDYYDENGVLNKDLFRDNEDLFI